MVEIWDNCLKTPVNGSSHKKNYFGPFFGYHNFQIQIDTWETSVKRGFQSASRETVLHQLNCKSLQPSATLWWNVLNEFLK